MKYCLTNSPIVEALSVFGKAQPRIHHHHCNDPFWDPIYGVATIREMLPFPIEEETINLLWDLFIGINHRLVTRVTNETRYRELIAVLDELPHLLPSGYFDLSDIDDCKEYLFLLTH